MDGDRPVVDGRDLLEFELQNLIRKVWNDACKYGDGLRYAGVDKKVFLNRYDYDIHKLLISYLDGPASDVGAQDEASEEGEMGDGVRSERNLANEFMCEFMDGFAEGIRDRSAQLETNGAFQHNLSEIKKSFRYTFKEFDDALPSTKPQVDEAF